MRGLSLYPTHLVAECTGHEIKLPMRGTEVDVSAHMAADLAVPIKLLLVMAAQAGLIRFPDPEIYKTHLLLCVVQFLEFNGGLSAAGSRRYGDDPVLKEAAKFHKTAKQKAVSEKVAVSAGTGDSPNVEAILPIQPLSVSHPTSESSDLGVEATPPLEGWYQGQPVSWLSPDELTPHPFNSTIYDVKPDAELLESVRLYGVLEPLVVTVDKKILGGQRRQIAAIEAHHPKVPAIITNAPVKYHELLIIHLNRQRHKTPIVVIREFIALEERASCEAELRQKAGKRLMENFPQVVGSARDDAARNSGYCGRTLADGAKAYLEAMRRKQVGLTPDQVTNVLATLERGSFSGALKLARSFKWFDEPAKKKCATSANSEGTRNAESDSPKTDIEAKIDAAVIQVSEGGRRTAFAFDEIHTAVGDGVAKAQIKRWLDRHIGAQKITSLKGGFYSCVTSERLITEKQDLEDEQKRITARLKQINEQLEEIGDEPWKPL